MNIEKDLLSVIEPVCKEQDVEIIETHFYQQGSRLRIQILVDTPSGISIEQCARLNRIIGEKVEKVEGLLGLSYTIEVSSPGLDRILKTKRDFERMMGKQLHIITKEAIEGRTDWIGTVKRVSEEAIEVAVKLKDEEKTLFIQIESIVKAQQKI